MTGLLGVSQVRLSADLLEHTHASLRKIGNDQVEGLVLWAGRRDGYVFTVEAVIRPSQQAIRSDEGLSVHVEGAAIRRVDAFLYDHSMELLAQVHSHPGLAFHSALDDAIPLVTRVGGLSLVVPDFARGPADLSTYAVYRLSEDGAWETVSPALVSELITIVSDGSSSPAPSPD